MFSKRNFEAPVYKQREDKQLGGEEVGNTKKIRSVGGICEGKKTGHF